MNLDDMDFATDTRPSLTGAVVPIKPPRGPSRYPAPLHKHREAAGVCVKCGMPWELVAAYRAYKRATEDHTLPPRPSVEERFWAYVTKTADCWLWTGPVTHGGYGRLKVSNRARAAHRLSFEMHVGPIPEGLNVLHHCDNPPCVNPAHLYAGTDADNVRDRDARGRTSRGPSHGRTRPPLKGEAHANHRLTWETVAAIRAGYTGRFGEQAEIARRLGVHPSVICKVLAGVRWI